MPDRPARQNRRSRPAPAEEPFRPHLRYPRLNADAGVSERPRPRRAAPRPRRQTRPPGANIRLDSSISVPHLRTRRAVTLPGGLKVGRLLSLLAIAGLVVLGYWLLTSNTFHVSKVEVKGSRVLSSSEVLKVTGADKANIFLLNEDELTGKLQDLPYVLTARVSKQLPDRLLVEITERKSALNWRVGSTNYLVDQDGVILDAAADKDLSVEAQTFVAIQSLDDRRLKPGDRVDAIAVRSAQVIQTELAQAGIKLAAVQYSPSSGLIVVSAPESGNWKALLGTDAQLDKKINILKGLLADKSIKWSYADLRFVNKPAIQ